MYKAVNYVVDKLIITYPGKSLLGFFNKVFSYLNYRVKYQLLDETTGLEKSIIAFFPDLTVKGGLFAGMKYPSTKAVCSAFFPKLSGTYENELTFVFEGLKKNKYDLIVDIGCAEGYYAVGMAMQFPNTPVYAYDSDPFARKLCSDMALLNQKQHQVFVNGACTVEVLSSLVMGKRCLILSDCEGYEEFLFTAENQHIFNQSDLIVELHPFQNKNIKKEIYQILSKGHQIQFVSSLDANRKALELSEEYIHFSNEEKVQIVNETRPYTMDWLIAYSV